ncbi:MAG TPA: GGDEF domain-containing protein [Kofleriaceae bacterium]|jgi:diguanylate cyclase
MSLLAGLRERRERGELSVELTSSRSRVQTLEDIAAAMLSCVQALVLDLDDCGAAELKGRLAGFAGRLHGGGATPELAGELPGIRKDTLEFAELERKHLATRDAELRNIIQVLTEGLAAVGAGAAAYHRRILDNGARFEAASRLSDLARMRASITNEVAALRDAVAERQAQETSTTAALRSEIDLLRVKVAREQQTARLDKLTRAANRTAFDEELVRRCELAATGGTAFSLLLVDVDHFKKINDTHGHQTGDRVLHALATFLRDHTRADDVVARWGGEEFAVILPGASARSAYNKAKDLVTGLAGSDWTIDRGNKLRFTVSIGVAAWCEGDLPTTILERVDKALYAAKNAGRNQAVKS